MGVILGGHGTVDHGDLSYKGVHEEEAGKNHGVCSRETNIGTFYRHRADVGFL